MRSALDRLAARFPGGPQGNRNLTALLGAVLLVGIVVELATLALGLQQTLTVHIAVGVALIPLVAVKLASTGWRMVRYYTRTPAYRAEGPPRPLLRGIAPLVVGSTLALLASGVGLVVAGPNSSSSVPSTRRASRSSCSSSAPTRSPICQSCAVSRSPTGHAARARGHALRRTVVGFALVAGGSLAVAAVQVSGPWVQAFQHSVGG